MTEPSRRLPVGAEVQPGGGVHVRVWAPDRKRVAVQVEGGPAVDLAPEANGTGPVTLLQTADGKLYLFNQPGRVLRIQPTPGRSEPFKLEATFTKGVPTVADPTRIWLDPGGRIVMVYEDRLAVMFPQGYIPPRIQDLMEPQDLEMLAE